MVGYMKKSILVLFSAVVCCLGCEKTNERFAPAATGLSVTASIRVEMEDGSQVEKGAPLTVWRLDNTKYIFNASESGSSVTFMPASGQEEARGIAYALYPDVEVASLNHGVFNVTLPSIQSNDSQSPCIYAGHVAGDNAILKRTCGFISFTVNRDNVARVEMSSSDPLSGSAKLSMSDVPTIAAAAGSDKTLVLTGNFENGETYMVAALPGTLQDLTVKMRNASGRQICLQKFTGPMTLSPEGILELGQIGEPEKPLEPGDKLALLENFVLPDGSELENVWLPDAEISIFQDDANEKFKLKSGAGTTDGIFYGKVLSGVQDGALFPYDDNAAIESGAVTTRVNPSQKVSVSTGGSLVNDSLLAYGVDEDGIVLKNVCALLRFDISGDNIGEVIISGNDGEDIAGRISVTMNGSEPAHTVLDGSKTISLKPSEGEAFKSGSYYAAILPAKYDKGLTLTMKPASFTVDNVVKRVFLPGTPLTFSSPAIEAGRSRVADLGMIDQNRVWSYGMLTMAALRGSKTDSGVYLDFSTGRTFYAIGAYAYSDVIDLAIVSNTSNGCAPVSITAVGAYTNAINLGRFGTCSEADYVANWPVRLGAKFCYVPATELSDEQYEALSTTQDIKAIYTAHEADAVNSYYTPTPYCVTNANRTTSHKYLVVKTYSAAEGTGYGIVKFSAVGGGTWYLQLYYKFGIETTNN